MTVRAKFYVQANEEVGGYQPGVDRPVNSWKLQLIPIWEGAGPDGSNLAQENHIFSKHTPTGKLEMTITNEPAAKFFKPGMCYYLDFTEAGMPAYAKAKS